MPREYETFCHRGLHWFAISNGHVIIYFQKSDKMHILDTFAKQELGVDYEVPDVYEDSPKQQDKLDLQGQHGASSIGSSHARNPRDTAAPPEKFGLYYGPGNETSSGQFYSNGNDVVAVLSEVDEVLNHLKVKTCSLHTK